MAHAARRTPMSRRERWGWRGARGAHHAPMISEESRVEGLQLRFYHLFLMDERCDIAPAQVCAVVDVSRRTVG